MKIKRYIKLLLPCLLVQVSTFFCSAQSLSPDGSKLPYQDSSLSVDQRVEDLLSRMTLEEKIGQINMPGLFKMNMGGDSQFKSNGCRKFVEGSYLDSIGPGGGLFGVGNTILLDGARQQAEFFNELQKIALTKTRLKIPLLQTEEGTHGLMCAGATIFPEGLAIGSTWNMEIVRDIYAVAAKEARAIGIHELCTFVIEPNRDPRMGRNEEGYSEDTYMSSHIAEAIVEGVQGNDISSNEKTVAVLCHFPGQTQPMKIQHERGSMEISELTLREVFLPPWQAGIKKGALGVMATYPSINGLPVHTSKWLLTDILRDELGFTGLVLCEGDGIGIPFDQRTTSTEKEAGAQVLEAGLDVSISFEPGYLKDMVENVQEGRVSIETIDRTVRRILRLKFMLGLFEKPYVDPERAVQVSHSKKHVELALNAAREGIVLLKNENNLLPLNRDKIKSIAVIGPNANDTVNQLGDYFSENSVLQHVTTVLEGVKKKMVPGTKIKYVKGCNILDFKLNEINKAKEAAKNADIAIVVVGESLETNGEDKDVASLDLQGLQEKLVEAVYSTGTPTIVVLINGRPLSTRWIAENIPGVVEAWNCGEAGGDAISDVIFGDYNPSGKLPITVPRHVGQLPAYYNYKPTPVTLPLVDMSSSPLYEFGFGLSYTTFEYSDLQIEPCLPAEQFGTGSGAVIKCKVKNIGKRQGQEVVQLYIQDAVASVVTPIKLLKGFKKISLEPGEEKTVEFVLYPRDLSVLNRHLEWVVEPGLFHMMVGSSSEDIRLNGDLKIN